MVLNRCLSPLLNLLFPPLCLHCRYSTGDLKQKLCSACLVQMTLIELEGRCPRCFAEKEEGICLRCRKRGSPFKRMVSAFEYEGPAATLVQQLKFGKREELAKDFASWMLVQFLRLDVPLPDLIIPVPQPFLRTWMRGYNQSLLIAQEVARLLERPCLNLLKKRSGDFPQTGLSKEQRENLSRDAITWKKRYPISDKTILLIDDVMTTGSTLQRSAEVLQEGYPAALYALTFCC